MARWMTSDESTALGLRARQIESESISANAVDQALRADSAVLVLPAGGPDVLVARIRRTARTKPEFTVARWTDESAVGYQAGGMLGLLDEPVYEEEEQKPPKKKWWRRTD